MANLFGLDIAQIVHDSIQGAGGLEAATLVKSTPGTRDPSNPTVAPTATLVRHSCQAIMEMRKERIEGTLTGEVMPVITIIGKSVSPAAVPVVNDQVEISSITYTLTKLISRDPASAVYEFEAA